MQLERSVLKKIFAHYETNRTLKIRENTIEIKLCINVHYEIKDLRLCYHKINLIIFRIVWAEFLNQIWFRIKAILKPIFLITTFLRRQLIF